jgi:hypothetical protein
VPQEFQAAVTLSVQGILEHASCRTATSVERMAHRWYRVAPRNGAPEMLLAPRFGRVPPLRIESPSTDRAWEVHVEAWSPHDWFSHLRVSWPNVPFPVTVANSRIDGRPHPKEDTHTPDPRQYWGGYVCTIPAGTPWIEISKVEEMEACLLGVSFHPSAGPTESAPENGPRIIGITDTACLMSWTLQAYDWELVAEFYSQMADMGFTHVFEQAYGGTATWCDEAHPHVPTEWGHMSYANYNEPAGPCVNYGPACGSGQQRNIDAIRAAGMKASASFRINNEWLADWTKQYWPDDPKSPWASQFSVDHPEFWNTYKSGDRSGGGLDFAFDEVKEYRFNIIKTWCEKFENFDGINIDVYRHPPMVSYPDHLVAEFKRVTGIDVRTVEPIDEDTILPEWLTFRAQHFTQWMREVRMLLKERYGDAMELSARVANTFDRALLDGCDLKVWLDEGLVDTLILQHRPPANPMETDIRPILQAAQAKGIEVIPLFGGNTAVNFDTPDLSPLHPKLKTWRDLGLNGLGFYEAERIARDGRWLRELPGITNTW